MKPKQQELSREAKALEIIEQLARMFRDPDEPINGGDLVDWLGVKLERAGFLDEVRKGRQT